MRLRCRKGNKPADPEDGPQYARLRSGTTGAYGSVREQPVAIGSGLVTGMTGVARRRYDDHALCIRTGLQLYGTRNFMQYPLSLVTSSRRFLVDDCQLRRRK